MSQSSAHSHHWLPPSNISPGETQERKNTCLPAGKQRMSQSSGTAATPQAEPWGNSGPKTQDADPREPRCISKEQFHWAQTLTSSQTKKSTKFLEISVFGFNWCSDYCPLLKSFYKTWQPPLPPLSNSLRVTWDVASQVPSPKNSCQIKLSQLLGCE